MIIIIVATILFIVVLLHYFIFFPLLYSCSTGTSCTTYSLTISERLGRSISKEQYAFLHKTSTVEVLSTYQFDDSADDIFEREPFTVFVRSKVKG